MEWAWGIDPDKAVTLAAWPTWTSVRAPCRAGTLASTQVGTHSPTPYRRFPFQIRAPELFDHVRDSPALPWFCSDDIILLMTIPRVVYLMDDETLDDEIARGQEETWEWADSQKRSYGGLTLNMGASYRCDHPLGAVSYCIWANRTNVEPGNIADDLIDLAQCAIAFLSGHLQDVDYFLRHLMPSHWRRESRVRDILRCALFNVLTVSPVIRGVDRSSEQRAIWGSIPTEERLPHVVGGLRARHALHAGQDYDRCGCRILEVLTTPPASIGLEAAHKIWNLLPSKERWTYLRQSVINEARRLCRDAPRRDPTRDPLVHSKPLSPDFPDQQPSPLEMAERALKRERVEKALREPCFTDADRQLVSLIFKGSPAVDALESVGAPWTRYISLVSKLRRRLSK